MRKILVSLAVVLVAVAVAGARADDTTIPDSSGWPMDYVEYEIIGEGPAVVCLFEDQICYAHALWRDAQETAILNEDAGAFVPFEVDVQALMGTPWYIQALVLDERARRFETAPPYISPDHYSPALLASVKN